MLDLNQDNQSHQKLLKEDGAKGPYEFNKFPNTREPDYKMKMKVWNFTQSGYWFLKGSEFYANSDFENAMDSYRKAIQLDIYNVDAMLNLSAIYEMRKRYCVASKWYRIIISIDPNYLEAYYGYAIC